MSIHRLAAVAAGLTVGLSSQAVQAQSYSAFDLGTLGGSTLIGTALNNLGQVVGSSTTVGGATHAFITGANGLGLTDLGTLGGASSYALAINDAGQVVGRAARADGLTRAFATGAGGVGMTDLGTLGGSTSGATGINNLGQIVGYAVAGDGNTRAFSAASAGAPLVNLGSFSGGRGSTPTAFSGANAVNDSGKVVGSATESCNCAGAAFSSQVGVPGISHIAGLSGNISSATAVNASGQIVGYTNGFTATPELPPHLLGNRAFVTGPNGVGMTDLGALMGGVASAAFAINNLGQVGGSFSVGSESHGFVTGLNGLEYLDVNSLVAPIAGLYFTSVVGLNDVGQLLVTASNSRSYLLSAVPEAGTNALMGLGLGLMGVVVARRKARHRAEEAAV
ncbi:MAG: PEP-CTERM sorting domain-containing protein [Aquabacterium sp.]|uniref:PEP-CTERM sorting domain-containing protein n=1 Tax=Aquabacterium sp. TaxID=1872578 RepID=UPI002728DBDA|nr:PEP-CTERM sorting domain-containing protein [Aquabacterium sp.]MDO9004847.1 PEP-CTERM sorting domain-containing protein [Aquabacterium sp.]